MSNKFKVKKITKFNDLAEGKELEIPTSDLCLTSDTDIVQFEYVEDEEFQEKVIIKPGVYTANRGQTGIKLDKTELRVDHLLTSVTNTSAILGEVDRFFGKLHVYEQLSLPKKRAILLFSDPGLGKSTAIRQSIRSLIDKDPGTVAVIWPTSDLRAEDFSKYLSFSVEYSEECTNLLLIMEDIGGSEEEGSGRPRDAGSGLLNMLDGVSLVFKLPTFMIATTNFPSALLSSLSDRPGRFDQMIELMPPKHSEQIALMEFITKRQLTDDEKNAFKIKGAELMSIAHLNEIAVRSLLHDKSFADVIKELIDHSAKVKKDFSKAKSMGIGWDD